MNFNFYMHLNFHYNFKILLQKSPLAQDPGVTISPHTGGTPRFSKFLEIEKKCNVFIFLV